PFRHLYRRHVFAREIVSQSHVVQTGCRVRIARVEPDASLESGETFLRAPRKDQSLGERVVRMSQVWRRCQRTLGFGKSTFIVAAPPECGRKAGAGTRMGAGAAGGPPGQCLDGALRFGETPRLKVSRLGMSHGEAHIGSRKGRVEINRPLKELLGESVVVRS